MQEIRKQLVEQYLRSYNEFDIPGMTTTLHEAIVFENAADGEVTLRTEGLAQFSAQAEQARQLFMQRKQVVTAWEFREEDEMIAEIDYQAVVAKPLPNGMRPGDRLSLQGRSTFRFRDDKIVYICDES